MRLPPKVLHSPRLISIILFKSLQAGEAKTEQLSISHSGRGSNLAVGLQSGLNESQLCGVLGGGEVGRGKVIHSEMRQCFAEKLVKCGL